MAESGRVKLRIDLNKLNDTELDIVFEAISAFASSISVNSKKSYKTEEQTPQAAIEFLSEIATNSEWLVADCC